METFLIILAVLFLILGVCFIPVTDGGSLLLGGMISILCWAGANDSAPTSTLSSKIIPHESLLLTKTDIGYYIYYKDQVHKVTSFEGATKVGEGKFDLYEQEIFHDGYPSSKRIIFTLFDYSGNQLK